MPQLLGFLAAGGYDRYRDFRPPFGLRSGHVQSLILAAIFVITTLVGVCPAYVPFGLSTKKKDGKGACCPH